jgi:serine/threonine-protein kinase
MGRPVNLRDLVDVIRRSRLIDDRKLADVLRDVRSADPDAPSAEGLLNRLTADGLLTRFQADQLGAGRWKGFTVGSYKLLDKLGSGGMGRVFLAEHGVLGKRVAIKVLEGKLAADPVARQRFTLEARAAAALDHPNIVHVIDLEADADPPYIVMDYVEGVTFQAAVQKCGPMNPGTAAYCARQVAAGLQLAYEVGLVHRDIKPANLLVDKRGVAKILDLGIVRIPGESVTMELDCKPILGTADYLAPEQAVDSSNVDTRADIYALGATMYYLLTGQPPYPDGSAALKIARKQVADPPWLGRIRPDVPEALATVVHRMMARNPADRYPTPSLAAQALGPFATPDSGFPANLLAGQRSSPSSDFAQQLSGPPSPAVYAGGGMPGESGGSGFGLPHPSGNGSQTYELRAVNPGSGYHTAATVGAVAPAYPAAPVSWAPPAGTRPGAHLVSFGSWPGGANGNGTNGHAATPAYVVVPVVRPVPVPLPAPTLIPATSYSHPDADPSTLEMRVPRQGLVEEPPAALRAAPERRADNTAVWLAVGGLGVALVVAAVTAVLFLGGPAATPTAAVVKELPPPPARKPTLDVPRGVLVVQKKPVDHPAVFTSVRDAIRAVDRTRSHIEIWDDTWEEILNTAGLVVPSGVTITSKEGKTVVWRGPVPGPLPSPLPGQPPPQHPPFVSIPASNGLTIQNIEFDGGNHYQVCLQLGGGSTTLRNLLVRGFTQTGFHLSGAGSEPSPNVVEKCRIGLTPGRFSQTGAVRLTGGSHFHLTHNRIEGQFLYGVSVEAVTPGVRIEQNRVHGALGFTRCVYVSAAALQPPPPPPVPPEAPAEPRTTTLVVNRNVFADGYSGVQFATLPTAVQPDAFAITGNLFEKLQVLAQTDNIPPPFDRFDPTRRWVWDPGFDPVNETPVQPRAFRGTVELPEFPEGKPPRVCLDLASSGAVSVWVNGKPVDADRYTGWAGDTFELTPFVRTGQNTVAVRVAPVTPAELGFATPETAQYALRPGWTGRVRVTAVPAQGGLPAQPTSLAVTAAAGKAWKVKRTPEAGWEAPDFNDATWQPVADVMNPLAPTSPYIPPISGWASRGDISRPGILTAFKTSGNAVAFPTMPAPHEGFPILRASRLSLKEPLPRDATVDRTFLRHRDADVPERFRRTFGFPQE